MESLFILIPIALVFVAIAIRIFFWAVKSGQFEDLDTEAKRILFDDEPKAKKPPAAAQAENGVNTAVKKSLDTKVIPEPTENKRCTATTQKENHV